MRITSIKVSNFKALLDFKMDFAKFTCLIGLNGSGKSSVLQFLDFLGAQMRGDVRAWLKQRNWKSTELRSHQSNKRTIDFRIDFDSENRGQGHWEASFNFKENLCRCTKETILYGEASLHVADEHYAIRSPGSSETSMRKSEAIVFNYEGSLLSQLKESHLPEPLNEFRTFINQIHALDLLSPEQLRMRSRESGGTLGLGGRRLSAFLDELGLEKRSALVQRLQSVYPQLQELETRALRSGWKELSIRENYDKVSKSLSREGTKTEARHVSDGMLRMMAFMAELETDHPFLIFDEIENGMNPEVVEFLLDALVQARQQVFVTTHSPLILNYLDDEIAKDGVIYLYRTPSGDTKAIPFFAIPSIEEKLAVMGPGEAFADTDLTQLQEEIAAVSGTR